MEALATITVFPSNKEEISKYFKTLKSEILAGDRDPLEILKQLKYVEKVIADILKDKDIEYHFIKEAELYGEKTFEYKGAMFTIQETGVRYDYEACGDPIWSDLNKELNTVKENIKAREKFLQNAHEGFVEPKTGVFVSSPPRKSKTKVMVRL